MSSEPWKRLEGGCPCGTIRYALKRRPLFVHCCHCQWCQREGGGAFSVTALIEASEIELLTTDEPEIVSAITDSTIGQRVARCPMCRFAVWSNYGSVGDFVRLIRVGTLDEPAALKPDLQIFTSTKLPWVQLAADIPTVPESYEREQFWPKESIERMKRADAQPMSFPLA